MSCRSARAAPFLNHGGITNVLLGGWQISPLLTYATGTPLTGDSSRRSSWQRHQQSPEHRRWPAVAVLLCQRLNRLPVLNSAAFPDPGPWAIGNEKRYVAGMRNPFNFNENIAVAKYFPLGERVRLKLEIEYFNALNRVLFGTPDTNLNDANFGRVINSQNNSPRQGQGYIEIRF